MELKEMAVRNLKGASGMFLQDLEALPEEAFTRKFGPKTRTIADIVYEVNLVNDHIGMVVRGEEPFAWPEGDWIFAPEDFTSRDQIIASFRASSDRIIEMAEGFSEDRMHEMISTEHGERSVYQRCQFMTLHLWYHSGQLNFIQTLLGDTEWHWK